jgi:hypothetical protein
MEHYTALMDPGDLAKRRRVEDQRWKDIQQIRRELARLLGAL